MHFIEKLGLISNTSNKKKLQAWKQDYKIFLGIIYGKQTCLQIKTPQEIENA